MRAIVQRVSAAEVKVGDSVLAECGVGLLLLVGVHRNDSDENARRLADRVVGLRIFNDGDGKINLSIKEIDGTPTIIAVSNFTVYGNCHKSRRPGFTDSAGFESGQRLFSVFVDALKELFSDVRTGRFGADMAVTLTNDGPVTLMLES